MPHARCASSSHELPDLPTFRVNREARSGVWTGVVLTNELDGPSRVVWAHRLKRSTMPELMEHESIDDAARRTVAALHREVSARSLPELEGNHSVRFDDCTGPS